LVSFYFGSLFTFGLFLSFFLCILSFYVFSENSSHVSLKYLIDARRLVDAKTSNLFASGKYLIDAKRSNLFASLKYLIDARRLVDAKRSNLLYKRYRHVERCNLFASIKYLIDAK